MEGEIRRWSWLRRHLAALAIALLGAPTAWTVAQDKSPAAGSEPAEISLRKSVQSKSYQGKPVDGEERRIGRGDSLWRILVEEKGVPEKRFASYLVIIRGLNPQVKNLDVLRVGDKIFVPLRPEQLLEERAANDGADEEQNRPGAGATVNYRIKAGEHLYQVLRDQLKLSNQRQIAQYFHLVKDLNPERSNWDLLVEGQVIRLPVARRAQDAVAAKSAVDSNLVVAAKPEPSVIADSKTDGAPVTASAPAAGIAADSKPRGEALVAPKPAAPIDRRAILRSPARENLALFAKVAESMGSQMQQSGEEVIALNEGAIRFDKKNYPVIFNPTLKQRVVIDPNDTIPASLRNKLGDAAIGAPVLSMGSGVTVRDAVAQLLSGLGYQALPADRPVIVHEDGISYEALGDWMALAPEENNKAQEIFVISLADEGPQLPEYLRAQLAKKGLHLKDVFIAPTTAALVDDGKKDSKDVFARVKTWPRDKKEIVDSLLLSFGIAFGVAETLSVELQSGLRLEARTDRVFDLSGKRTALFFQRADPEISKALQDKNGVRTLELELGALSAREVISRLLNLLGDQASYREHRFGATHGGASDRLTVTASGFYLPNRSMFITDRNIPVGLHRFFFDKGLEIVYFQ